MTAYLKPSQVADSRFRHVALSPEQTARVAKLQQTFADVLPRPLTDWVDDFRRDMHPDNEIAIWESIAKSYAEQTAGRGLTAKRRVLSRLLSQAPPITVAEQTN